MPMETCNGKGSKVVSPFRITVTLACIDFTVMEVLFLSKDACPCGRREALDNIVNQCSVLLQ